MVFWAPGLLLGFATTAAHISMDLYKQTMTAESIWDTMKETEANSVLECCSICDIDCDGVLFDKETGQCKAVRLDGPINDGSQSVIAKVKALTRATTATTTSKTTTTITSDLTENACQGETVANGKGFFIPSGTVKHNEANDTCLALNCQLATFPVEEERQAMIRAAIRHNNGGNYWLGMVKHNTSIECRSERCDGLVFWQDANGREMVNHLDFDWFDMTKEAQPIVRVQPVGDGVKLEIPSAFSFFSSEALCMCLCE